MRFIVQDNTPYLVSGGMAYPAEITEEAVKVDKDKGFETDKIGHLSINEVVAKIGYMKKQKSQTERKPRKGKDTGENLKGEE